MKEVYEVKGYKAFVSDLTCRGFQYEIGMSYKLDGELSIGKNGFHFCEKLQDCFSYYPFNRHTRVCVVYANRVLRHGDKVCTDEIFIAEELSWQEVLDLVNTGDGNTGFGNSGTRNSGNCNSGNHDSGLNNSGNRNTGNSNSGSYNVGVYNLGNRNVGNWNLSDSNTGDFNTTEDTTVRMFNKPCLKSDLEKYRYPDFLFFEYEGKDDYKKAFIASFENADETDRMRILDMPNFDKDIFFEISGIDIDKYR